jgi:hypothetical protein
VANRLDIGHSDLGSSCRVRNFARPATRILQFAATVLEVPECNDETSGDGSAAQSGGRESLARSGGGESNAESCGRESPARSSFEESAARSSGDETYGDKGAARSGSGDSPA